MIMDILSLSLFVIDPRSLILSRETSSKYSGKTHFSTKDNFFLIWILDK